MMIMMIMIEYQFKVKKLRKIPVFNCLCVKGRGCRSLIVLPHDSTGH